MPKPQIGQLAPDATLLTDSGATFQIKSCRGAPLVLYFYPADNTEGCTTEALEFGALMPEFDRLGIRVCGISPDTIARHLAFRAKFGLTVQLAADPDHHAIDAYGVWGRKVNFGRPYEGLIRTTFLIDGAGVIVNIWTVTRIKGHAQAVFAFAQVQL